MALGRKKADEEPEPVEEREPEPVEEEAVSAATISVRSIRERGDSVLVQWADDEGVLQRRFVPKGAVKGEQVSKTDLDQGIPYGVPWADLIEFKVTPKDFEKSLREAGVWTEADVQNSPQLVISALQRVYGIDLGTLRTLALSHGGK